MPGLRHVAHRADPRARRGSAGALRRPPRHAHQPMAATTSGIGDSLPATCFPTASGSARLGPRACPRVGRSDRRSRPMRRVSPSCSAPASTSSGRPWPAAISSTSRKTLSLPGSSAAGSSGVQGRGGGLPQALRRQQPGNRANAVSAGGPAHVARDLPAGVRNRRHQGATMDGDVRLQPGQRRVRRGKPGAAHRDPSQRVGIRRFRGLGLGCGHRARSRARRRPRPRDAAPPKGLPSRDRRGGRRRHARPKRCSTKR